MKVRIKITKLGSVYWAETVGGDQRYACGTSDESPEKAEEKLRENIKSELSFKPIEKEIEI